LEVKPFEEIVGYPIALFERSLREFQTDEAVMKFIEITGQMHKRTKQQSNRCRSYRCVGSNVDVISVFTKVAKLELSTAQGKDAPIVLIECHRKES
jgi:hypothetical protein